MYVSVSMGMDGMSLACGLGTGLFRLGVLQKWGGEMGTFKGMIVSCGGCWLLSWSGILATDIGSSAAVVATLPLTAIQEGGDWGSGILLGGFLWTARAQ